MNSQGGMEMKKQSFNENWIFRYGGEKECTAVTLPHDAQILQQRDPAYSDGGHGYFPGGKYEYRKTFFAPASMQEQTALLEFEGIYKNAAVYLNGEQIAFHAYGYTGFTVALNALRYGEENEVLVIADNSRLPNSRWYTGGGIYRPVWLWTAAKQHIRFEGVRVTTLSISPAVIRVETDCTDGEVAVAILDGEKTVATGSGTDCTIEIPDAKLWDDECPSLYTCRVTLSVDGTEQDTAQEVFGIRKIEWNKNGFFINGKQKQLRGGCIHHDNGILGAATYAKSEERRVRIMKQVGFNAIRSAHNPASKALLAACDRLGMLVMDETYDMWYSSKTYHDYGRDFEACWRDDVTAMVNRDYNHPSVIMYSIGNEVAEPGSEKGRKVGKEQIELIHRLDSTRPVTCGINLAILAMAAIGGGFYNGGDGGVTDVKLNKGDGKVKNGSLIFNTAANIVGPVMNGLGNLSIIEKQAAPFFKELDLVGYNYASGRYAIDAKKYPDRIVFGSETFPQDIYKNWEAVKKYPTVIGDFMWTAWDYLGEAGIGAWSYDGGVPFNRPYPWLIGGGGVINILGIPDGSCRYASTVWGKTDKPVIAVQPVNYPGIRPSKSIWRGTNAFESWSWKNCNGNKAVVEVYSTADSVEIKINGASAGRKKTKECKAVFETKYYDGDIVAYAYDKNGKLLATNTMHSARGEISIVLTPEEACVGVGDIAYIPVSLQGENGVTESNADRTLTARVENGTLLAFGSANPCTKEQYHTGTFTTYHGQALAIVRAEAAGTITLTVSDGTQTAQAEITATE